MALLFLPADCPQANPLERVRGKAQDRITRHHQRRRLRDLLGDVARHHAHYWPWRYELGSAFETPDAAAEYGKRKRAAAHATAA